MSAASSPSAAKAAGDPAPRWAKMTGRSAPARMSAAASIAAVLGPAMAGVISGRASMPVPGQGSHSTSRGRLR